MKRKRKQIKNLQENIRDKFIFKDKDKVNNPEKLINAIEKEAGYNIAQLARELINGKRSIESISDGKLEIIKKYAFLNSENYLCNFIDNYLKLPNGRLDHFKLSLTDREKNDENKIIYVNEDKKYKVVLKNNKLKIVMMNNKKINEETVSTKTLLKYNFEPTEEGWVLKGKNLVVFGGIKGLESLGFRKRFRNIIVGPDGSQFQYKIEDLPEKKLILKQINENNEMMFDKYEIEYGIDDNYFIDLFIDLIPNRDEIMMYYSISKGNIDETLEKLMHFNPSWRRIIENKGWDIAKKYLIKLISEYETDPDEESDYT